MLVENESEEKTKKGRARRACGSGSPCSAPASDVSHESFVAQAGKPVVLRLRGASEWVLRRKRGRMIGRLVAS